MWVGIQLWKAAPMTASVGQRAPMGERNEAGLLHLQQRSVSVPERPTCCITYDHRHEGTQNLSRSGDSPHRAWAGTSTSLPTKSFLVNRSWASLSPVRG